MKDKYLTRQSELISSQARDTSIVIVGAGAVGSFVSLALAKMGYIKQMVIDYDQIDPENMNCQFYRESDIDLPKVVALNMLIKDFTGETIQTKYEKIGPSDTLQSDIVISAVDNMEVRKHLFETSACKYLIDPRMAAEYATMRVVDMSNEEDKKNYAKSLYSDDEAVHERCTAKSTMYTVLLLAGQIAKAVKDLTTSGDSYIQGFDWSIEHNQLVAFNNKGIKL
jgi:molybdopterin/thiamine biosynthesis adenylyltransferase